MILKEQRVDANGLRKTTKVFVILMIIIMIILMIVILIIIFLQELGGLKPL